MNIPKEKIDKDFKIVAGIKNKNEKLSWTRRQKNLQKFVEETVNPLTEQIMILQAKHQEHIDEIVAIRKQMVKECIHPKDELVHHGTYIECKFCNNKLSLPRVK